MKRRDTGTVFHREDDGRPCLVVNNKGGYVVLPDFTRVDLLLEMPQEMRVTHIALACPELIVFEGDR